MGRALSSGVALRVILACRFAPATGSKAPAKALRRRPQTQAALLTAFLQRIAEENDDLAGAFIHRGAHIFRQIADLCRQLHRQTAADDALLAKLRQRMLIVGQEAVAIVPLAVVKMIDQALKISGVVMVEQRNAKGLL